MEEKHNNATKQRPEGARQLDGAVTPVNIERYISMLKNEEAYIRNGKNAITVFKSEEVTITLIALDINAEFHPGTEENEATMSLQVINGKVLFESYENKFEMKEGELVTLHQALSFKTIAIDETICLITLVK